MKAIKHDTYQNIAGLKPITKITENKQKRRRMKETDNIAQTCVHV